jgi:hypothetical protein
MQSSMELRGQNYALAESGSYSIPFFNTAQAMRAGFLAKVTAATL